MRIIICCEPAENEDYACNTCGGDIRGLKCCNMEFCTIEEVKDKAK